MAQINVTEVLAPIAQLCRQCPTPVLIKAYIDAAREFCKKTRWLVATAPGLTVADYFRYAIGGDAYHEVIGIQAMTALVSGKTRPLTEKNSAEWNADDTATAPIFYQYIPEAQFAVHPIPDTQYTLSLSVVIQPLRQATTINDVLLPNWEDALRMGTLAYLFRISGQPWTDKTESSIQMGLFGDQINQARSSVARGYNAGALPTGIEGPRQGAVRTGLLTI